MLHHHPDRVRRSEKEQAAVQAAKIKLAYETLSDTWERWVYDWFGLDEYVMHKSVLECFGSELKRGVDVQAPRKRVFRKKVLWCSQDKLTLYHHKYRAFDRPPQKVEDAKIDVRRIIDVVSFTPASSKRKTNRLILSLAPGSHPTAYPNDEAVFDVASKDAADFLASRLRLFVVDVTQDAEWMERLYEVPL